MTDKLIDQLYNAGMQFAGALRLLGKHEEAHDVELWVLALQAELGACASSGIAGVNHAH